MAAWRRLLSLLRPGGVMSLGLYSEAGREPIRCARAFIAQRGYQPTVADIRACRDSIAQSDEPLLKSVATRVDFYARSECRDLLFHVEEHHVTIPQIAAFIDQEKLATGHFAISRASGIFPDGLLFEIPDADPVPASRALAEVFEPLGERDRD